MTELCQLVQSRYWSHSYAHFKPLKKPRNRSRMRQQTPMV